MAEVLVHRFRIPLLGEVRCYEWRGDRREFLYIAHELEATDAVRKLPWPLVKIADFAEWDAGVYVRTDEWLGELLDAQLAINLALWREVARAAERNRQWQLFSKISGLGARASRSFSSFWRLVSQYASWEPKLFWFYSWRLLAEAGILILAISLAVWLVVRISESL